MNSLTKTFQIFAVLGLASLSSAQSSGASFWAITSANASVTALDAYSTLTRVGHTATCPVEAWSPVLYGRKPTPNQVSFVMGGLLAASAALSYGLKRRRMPLWFAPQAYLGGVHLFGAIHNLHFCH